MASTTGKFNVTNITLTRSLDVSAFTIDSLADVIGTVIYDWQGDNLPQTYTITNATTAHIWDTDATSANELANVLASAITDNSTKTAANYSMAGYVFANATATYTLDCDATSLDALADILASFASHSSKWRPNTVSIARLGPGSCAIAGV